MKHSQAILRYCFVILCVFILFTGCVKGPKGDQGDPGLNGQAVQNVHSFSFTVSPTQWYYYGSGFYYYDASISQITQNVVDSGSLSMFVEGNSGVWLALPYTISNSSTNFINYGFNYSLGHSRVWMDNSTQSTLSITSSYTYRAVIVSSTMRVNHPNVNWNDPVQVMAIIDAQPHALNH